VATLPVGVQGHLDRALAAPANQAARQHAGVVEHQKVGRLEQIRKIEHPPMLQALIHHQEPRGIPQPRRMLRDQLRRQVKIEQLRTADAVLAHLAGFLQEL
jgi:hypothetical protein